MDTNEEASLLHGSGINGKLVVVVCLIAAALIGVGMIGALTNAEVDESYVLPDATATEPAILPWSN